MPMSGRFYNFVALQMWKCISTGFAVIVVGSAVMISYLSRTPSLPELDEDKWWGIGDKPREQETSIKIFNIDFNDTMIADLRSRLKSRRPLTRPLEGIHSEYGINTLYLDKILTYWFDGYKFKERVHNMNKFAHFKTRIQGLDIHFIRVKPREQRGVRVLPLLLLHGWPSSSREFLEIIPTLTKPRHDFNFIFEIIAPDLPGFGFSEATSKPGLNSVQMGIMMRNLMKRLGIDKFYIQAGDWGSQCATHICTLFPKEVLGFHTNMPLSSRPISFIKYILGVFAPRLVVNREYEDRLYPWQSLVKYILRESGYFHMQATKPDTIGVALNDSPSGLAAYIMEKMAICSNRDELNTDHGGLKHLQIDEVIDTITIVWVNRCATTSMRLYAEATEKSTPEIKILHNIPTPVPTAAINFKYEVLYQPDWLLKDKFPNLVRSSTLDIGGHFAALQTSQVLAEDIFIATKEFIAFNDNHPTRFE